MIEGFCVWFLVYSSFIFLNVHKICNRLISKPGHLYIFSPGKASRGYAALRSVFYGFWAQGSHILLKVQKICNWLIYNMVIFEKPCFSPYGLAPWGYFTLRGFSVDFEHMAFIFLWNYIKFLVANWFIIWLYLGTLNFHLMGRPLEGIITPGGLCIAVLWLPPLRFLISLLYGRSEPNFMLLSQLLRFLQYHVLVHDVLTFTEEIFNGKLHFLCSVCAFYFVQYICHFTSLITNIFSDCIFCLLDEKSTPRSYTKKFLKI